MALEPHSTQGELMIESEPELPQDYAERITGLNRHITNVLSYALKKDPARDLTGVLDELKQTYEKKKARLERPVAQRRNRKRSPSPSSTGASGVLRPQPPPLDFDVLLPLDSSVEELLGLAPTPDLQPLNSSVDSHLQKLIAAGTVFLAGKVVRISSDIVLKYGTNVGEHEAKLMLFVYVNCPRVRCPQVLGMLSRNNVRYLFMSFVEGSTAAALWPSLSPAQKIAVRDELDLILTELHDVPRPDGTALGSFGDPPVCMDTRMWTRTAEGIKDEEAFKDFLLRNPAPRISDVFMQWLRSSMRTDHRIVLTHGDLHSKNIILKLAEDGSVSVSGIVDWGLGGWYPEYWEALKATNLLGTNEESDWWLHLPGQFAQFMPEITMDRLVEQMIVPM